MERVMIRPSAWWKATRGIPPEKRGPFMDEVMECVEENRRGVNPFADTLLDEAQAFIDKCKAAGAAGGKAKAANRARLATTSDPKQPLATLRDAKGTPSDPKGGLATLSAPVATLSDPLATPTYKHNIIETDTVSHDITQGSYPDTRTREDGQTERSKAESERDGNRNRVQDPEEQSTIPARIAATMPLESVVGNTLAATRPAPKPAPQATPAANAEPSKPTAPSAPAKPAPSGKSGPFSWSDLSEDKQRYVWTIAPTLLPQFAVWFCQEPDNAKAKAVYEKFCARFGAEPFRILLDKFVASVFAGEEPDNRGAAFMATVMAEGRERQAELAKAGNKQNQTNKQNQQNKGENK